MHTKIEVSSNNFSNVLDFLTVVPWIKTVLHNNEEGVAYFSHDNEIRLAVFKKGVFLYSADIHNQMYIFKSFGVIKKVIFKEPIFIKDIMNFNAKVRCNGWTDRQFRDSFNDRANNILESSSNGDFLYDIVLSNSKSFSSEVMLYFAIDAYDCLKREFLAGRYNEVISHSNTDIMALVFYIVWINPCLGRKWDYRYNRQGQKNTNTSNISCELKAAHGIILNILKDYSDRNNKTYHHNEELNKDTLALFKVAKILEKEMLNDFTKKSLCLHAVLAVKSKLSEIGSLSPSGKVGKHWVLVIATAWGTTEANISSALRKIDSMEMTRYYPCFKDDAGYQNKFEDIETVLKKL